MSKTLRDVWLEKYSFSLSEQEAEFAKLVAQKILECIEGCSPSSSYYFYLYGQPDDIRYELISKYFKEEQKVNVKFTVGNSSFNKQKGCLNVKFSFDIE